MSEKQLDRSENERVVFMSAVAEAVSLLRTIAAPRAADDSVKALIVRAARRVGFGFERAKSLWYGEARWVDAEEMDTLRAVAAARAARQEAEAIHDRQRLVERIAVIEARLAQIDPDFHGEDVAALRVFRGAGGRPASGLGGPLADD